MCCYTKRWYGQQELSEWYGQQELSELLVPAEAPECSTCLKAEGDFGGKDILFCPSNHSLIVPHLQIASSLLVFADLHADLMLTSC